MWTVKTLDKAIIFSSSTNTILDLQYLTSLLQVTLLQRIVAYLCFLETQIEELSLSLDLDPMINQISEISYNVHDIGEFYRTNMCLKLKSHVFTHI